MIEKNRISIEISGQVFTIKAFSEDTERINKAIRLVEETLKACKKSGEVDSLRLSLMTAFHIAFDLMNYIETDSTPDELARIEDHLDKLKLKILNTIKDDHKKKDKNPLT